MRLLLFLALFVLSTTMVLAGHSATLAGNPQAHVFDSPPTVSVPVAIAVVGFFGLAPFLFAYLVFLHRSKKQKPAPQLKSVPKGPAAPEGKEFKTKKGAEITTVAQLADYLEKMDDDEFIHHVNEEKNDFAVWIEHAVGYEELAKKLAETKTKPAILKLLRSA